jgi:hypothetical protein
VVAGYELMMTTEAVGWHLVAPAGGSRVVERTPEGNRFTSHRDEFEADDRLFRARLDALLAGGYRRDHFARYRVADLERGTTRPRPHVGRLEAWARGVVRRLPAPLARQARRVRRGVARLRRA